MVEVTLEEIPQKMDEATVQAWFFEEGDVITEGDDLVELAAGESTVTIQAKTTGILAEVCYDEGDSVAKGEVLCLIDEKDADDDKDEEDDEEDDDDDDDEDDEDEDEEEEDE